MGPARMRRIQVPFHGMAGAAVSNKATAGGAAKEFVSVYACPFIIGPGDEARFNLNGFLNFNSFRL